MIVLVMGVSGSGKTTIGEALAKELGWTYLDADDFHPKANIEKMASGVPLQDADRWPWLERLNRQLKKAQRERQSVVLGCSALKQVYRDRLARGIAGLKVVYLKGEFDLLRARVQARKHRYMPAKLLRSQFDTLEPPTEAIEIDVSAPLASSLRKIEARLRA